MFVTYEAPKRRKHRFALAAASCADRADRPSSLTDGFFAPALTEPSARLDPDTDPADAMLLRIGPSRAISDPAALLALADAAFGSPR